MAARHSVAFVQCVLNWTAPCCASWHSSAASCNGTFGTAVPVLLSMLQRATAEATRRASSQKRKLEQMQAACQQTLAEACA